MRKVVAMAVLAGFVSAASGCTYAGVAMTPNKAVIARNDSFLFGLLRKVYVCEVTDNGLASCASKDSP